MSKMPHDQVEPLTAPSAPVIPKVYPSQPGFQPDFHAPGGPAAAAAPPPYPVVEQHPPPPSHSVMSNGQFQQAPPNPSQSFGGAGGPPPVIIQQPISQQTIPIMAAPTYFGKDPGIKRCQNCNEEILTKTRPVPGTLTWLSALVCCILGCWCCCCCPFCMDSFQDVEHLCPKCNSPIGIHKRL